MKFPLLAIAFPILLGAQPARFDAISIKPNASAGNNSPFPACGGDRLTLNRSRLIASNVTLYKLITWAWGIRYSCFIVSEGGLLTGGPKWILTDRFDLQATIPSGTPEYDATQFASAAAPEVQNMLRAALVERFHVELHVSSKEMNVYTLSVAPGGAKLVPADPQRPRQLSLLLEPDENKETIVHVIGNKATISDFTHVVEPVTHLPVLDRTGLKDEYAFDLKFAVIDPFTGVLAAQYGAGATSPTIFAVLQNQFGLKLTRTTGPADIWVIDRAEYPNEN